MIHRLARALAHLFDTIVWGSILAIAGRNRSGREEEVRREERKRTWKQRAREALILFAALGVLGFLVSASGVVSIKASAGHWPITRWFLNFSSARSVSTHTIGMKVPPLDDPALVVKGAGHFDFGCRPCHGSPELRQPRIAAEMTPHPPYLPEKVPLWEPQELFYIVKHGFKLTGMPAWPALQREDEVWAVVAFLQRMPGMTADQYRALARGDLDELPGVTVLDPLAGPLRVPSAVLQNCGRCHGIDGRGRGLGAFPSLAGQKPLYLYLAMQAYARGQRHSGIMEPVAAGLSLTEMRELAQWYGTRAPAGGIATRKVAGEASDAEAIARGARIADRGIPSKKVPACADCHGPSPLPKNRAYPLLAGQYEDYLVLQLEIFKKEIRGGSPYAHLMHEVAPKLDEQEMRDVAAYYASLR